MAFQWVPSQLRIPDVPGFEPPNGFWRGTGSDDGYFAFRTVYGWGGYVMTKRDFCYSLKIGTAVMTPVYSSVNGYIYWEGYGYVYYSLTKGWVWSSLFPGYEPVEDLTYDSDKKTLVGSGDSFYSLGYPPYYEDAEVTLTPRGSIYGKETKTATAVWDRWASSREFGKYEPMGDAEGDRYLGLPRFRGGGEDFVRSYAKENGYYTYGRIHRSASGKWVIGEVGADSGWHEGGEPSKEGSVTFKFRKNEESEAAGSDITVSLLDYVKGDETAAAFLGEVAIWR